MPDLSNSAARHSYRAGDVLQRIQAEYLEMPGLRLTVGQAQRLWGLDRTACEQMLATLVHERFLAQTRDGAFILARSV